MLDASGPPDDDALAALLAPPARPEAERLLIVARLAPEPGSDGEASRYLLVRWPDWPHPALLSIDPPPASDSLDDAVGTLLRARLQVALQGPVRLSSTRIPVRMPLHRYGASGTGWLRPAAVEVTGAPEPDSLLDGFEALTLDDALAALPTDVERAVLRDGAALL